MKINKRKDSLILYSVGICFVCLLLVGIFSKKHFDVSDYITINYIGADGYASAECTVDREKMYKEIAGNEKDEQKLELYKKLVDNILANVENIDISNGDKIFVNVSCDEEIAEAAGIKVNDSYTLRASGIGDGEKINIFDNIEVVFAGISPDAYVMVNNNWENDYLGSLTFSASKNVDIVTGDEITLKCDTDLTELARNGFIAETETMKYKADGLSSYIEDTAQLDEDIIKNINEQNIAAINSQTTDKTFRMLYKATGDKDYLYTLNDETAQNIFLNGQYFLKLKENTADIADNYLIWIYSAEISNGEDTEIVYFAFEYSQGFLNVEGEFNISFDNVKDRYECSTDYEKIYEKYITGREKDYNIVNLMD